MRQRTYSIWVIIGRTLRVIYWHESHSAASRIRKFACACQTRVNSISARLVLYWPRKSTSRCLIHIVEIRSRLSHLTLGCCCGIAAYIRAHTLKLKFTSLSSSFTQVIHRRCKSSGHESYAHLSIV